VSRGEHDAVDILVADLGTAIVHAASSSAGSKRRSVSRVCRFAGLAIGSLVSRGEHDVVDIHVAHLGTAIVETSVP
jgi:hypothetical protein